MSQRKFESYLENVSGAFYVEKDLCLTCTVPEAGAPNLIGFYGDPSGTNCQSHCHFKRQPETAEELDGAIKAVRVSCCGTYRYAGDDPDVKNKLRLSADDTAIDHA
jgi:hypothetical protein